MKLKLKLRHSDVPIIPVVVSYCLMNNVNSLTIGAWAVTFRKDGPVFSFFLKPSTRTYDLIAEGFLLKVYQDSDYMRFSRSIDKSQFHIDNLFLEAEVFRVTNLDEYRLIEAKVLCCYQIEYFQTLCRGRNEKISLT